MASRSEHHNEVTASFWVQPSWLPRQSANPLYLPVQQAWYTAEEWGKLRDTLRKAESATGGSALTALQELGSEFHETYGTPQCVRKAAERGAPSGPGSTWPRWYGSHDMIAIALGGPEPREVDGVLWNERERPVLAEVESPADVAKIRVPDWGALDVMQRMLESREQWRIDHPGEPPANLVGVDDLPVPGQDPVPSVGYAAFVDLGAYLMGMTHFLTIVGGNSDTADALMDLCFELTTSYMDFLLQTHPEDFEALGGFGGDGTCMLSPSLYDRYSAAWDDRLFESVRTRYGLADDAPCNLHSCGPSAHLYGRWGAHPRRRNIAVMQTRLMPGEVGRLRAALPDAQLELTLHPPHFDVVAATVDELSDVLWNSARDAGFRDVYLNMFAVVHRVEDLGKAERNLRSADATLAEIRQQPR